ncbi:NAD-glutamate dehydrogenase [Aureimonas mangrovi]|uniref:NAD-glutamate dehydrogenase n=1 Tax=Aureimonas mangrovi TaxID=2758041 RepID=UPI00163DE146|nr:NAD-glutamate dehydrogenase [Aureimonas mangrovi]
MATTPDKAQIIETVLREVPAGEARATLVPLLLARPPAEDLSAITPAALAIAAGRAAEALSRQKPGEAVVAVETPVGFAKGDETLQLVTVVTDDRAFLFDSVIAEIGETMPEVHYISHPILDVVRGADGAVKSFAAAHDTVPGANDRVSLMQIATGVPADPQAGARLAERIEAILRQIAAANDDFYAMRERTARAAFQLRRRAERVDTQGNRAEVEEAAAFLEWLTSDNFIFLGTREFAYEEEPEGRIMRRRPGSELGILRDPEVRVLRREGEDEGASAERQAFLEAPSPLIVAKANARSRVHRRVYMDYIGVKEYDREGRLCGELRIAGLFTAAAYTQPVLSIPYLRQKVQLVTMRFGLQPKSHSAKALANALETYSRDELFQIDVDLLERFVGIVLELGERPRVRVLPRVDPFDRFVSVLVFVPRERYDQRLREEIGVLLTQAYDGHVSAYYPSFPEGPLAQVHFIIGRTGGPTPTPEPAEIEARIVALSRSWADAYARAVARAGRSNELLSLAPGLPQGYREAVDPAEAVIDGGRIHALSKDAPLEVDFYRREGDPADLLRLKLYAYGAPLSLSTRVPILENMGFSVGAERTFEIARPDGSAVHLHDMDLARQGGGDIALSDAGAALEALYGAVGEGLIENDGFNALVLQAGLTWQEANVLRAYGRYLRQTGLAFTDAFLAATLLRHPALARALFDLFAAAFDPDAAREPAPPRSEEGEEDPLTARARERGAKAYRLTAEILAALDEVDSLDEDRVLRRFTQGVLATLRTNFYALGDPSAEAESRPGAVTPALAFKFDPHALDGLPQPVPFREIFVFDARVEGVHLRFGRVARGGLRWSDRSQDYRTEVLGLVKAQQVKNAVIVPVGAKGGFYPKRLPDASRRDAWFEAGRSAYVVFIASLLSITDNAVGEETVTPPRVLAHDGPDPYFVVAADKGTATFSDTANAIAQAEEFWLDDAFASGGSAGYDHKGMGITARGAWEAVKRHFREMDRDIQVEPFTVAGCGDMSGDVFGNGMLLSRQTKLVAAFDHRDIFIDPDPDPASSFAERERLFALPRSSWADYDKALLSKGGLIVSRREKRVRLPAEAAEAIGWDRREGTPAEIINAILKAPVDLLWFGGIGTYIRSSAESNADAGDRANDSVRVTGRDLRAKVVGEGANLGATQRGRIEFARAGGRINTDAIDNSAGVNTSDVEVNIKIALKGPMSDGRLPRDDRNALLSKMTGDVAALVLANNYQQTLALSLDEDNGAMRLPAQARLMTVLEDRGELSREVETLPSDAAIADLRAAGRGLTRPELAVLLAYGKIDLFDRILESDLPDDPYLGDRLHAYFPDAMRAEFAGEIDGHRLRREIVATALANDFVNRLGPAFAITFADAAGALPSRSVRAFVAASDGLGTGALYAAIDALDGTITSVAQFALYRATRSFLMQTTAWAVRNLPAGQSLSEAVAELRAACEALRPRVLELSSDRAREEYEARLAEHAGAGVPEAVAKEVALLPLLALVPDIVAVSRETGASRDQALSAYFGVTRHLRLGRVEGALRSLRPADYYEMLALERAGAQLSTARRALTAQALAQGGTAPADAWAEAGGEPLTRLRDQMLRMAGSGETSVARLGLAVGLLLDLSRENGVVS